jgi:hypothetical protein
MFVYKMFFKNVKKSTYISLQTYLLYYSKFATYYEIVIVLGRPAGTSLRTWLVPIK